MDDVVFRLLRELPDTDKDRYDIAYERGRAQVRSSLLFGGMAIGLVAGGLGLFLLDPVVGAGRRAQLAQRAKAVLNDLQRTIKGRSRDLRNRTLGAATELGLPGTPQSNVERRETAATTIWPRRGTRSGRRRGAPRRAPCAARTPGIGCRWLPAPRSADPAGQAAATGSGWLRTPRCRRAGVRVRDAAMSAPDNATRSHRLVW